MIKVARRTIAGLHFCFAGSRPAMISFAFAPLSIAGLPFDLRYTTPALLVAIGSGSLTPSDRFQTTAQCTSPTDRQRQNLHNV